MKKIDLADFSEGQKRCPECGEEAVEVEEKWLGQHHLKCSKGHEWAIEPCPKDE